MTDKNPREYRSWFFMCYLFTFAAIIFSSIDFSSKLFMVAIVFFVGGFFHWLVYTEERQKNEKK